MTRGLFLVRRWWREEIGPRLSHFHCVLIVDSDCAGICRLDDKDNPIETAHNYKTDKRFYCSCTNTIDKPRETKWANDLCKWNICGWITKQNLGLTMFFWILFIKKSWKKCISWFPQRCYAVLFSISVLLLLLIKIILIISIL